MRFKVGDMVFTRDGTPGVIVGRNGSGKAVVESEGEQFDKARRLGFINGLQPNQRSKFAEVVMKARKLPEPEKRMQVIQDQVDQLSTDPKNWVVKRYLESELAYIMNSEGVHPTTFSIGEEELI